MPTDRDSSLTSLSPKRPVECCADIGRLPVVDRAGHGRALGYLNPGAGMAARLRGFNDEHLREPGCFPGTRQSVIRNWIVVLRAFPELELESASRPCIVPSARFEASGLVLPTDSVFDYASAILRARALWRNVHPMATAESKRLPYYPRSPLLRASAQCRLRVVFRCRSACLPVQATIRQ